MKSISFEIIEIASKSIFFWRWYRLINIFNNFLHGIGSHFLFWEIKVSDDENLLPNKKILTA